MDPMFPRSLPNSPLSPTFTSPIQATRNGNIETRKSLKPVDTLAKSVAKRSTLAPSPNASSAESRSTTPNSSQEKEASSSVSTTNHLGINFDSPAMEASMFPTYKAQTPVEDTPVMSRSFIDSRDRPYSQAKPRNDNLSPISPHSAKIISPTQPSPMPFSPSTDSPASAGINFNSPFSIESFKIPASAPTTAINSPVEQTRKSTAPSISTIGTPFEATSAAHPPPQLVATRPKTEGAMSTIAGVQVPTHHSTGVRRDSISAASKSDKRRTKLLNPMALLSRRKSPNDQPVVEEKKPQSQAPPRQKAATTVGIEKLPEDFDPRIKGKIVHDFSAPRQPRRDFSSPTAAQPGDMLHGSDMSMQDNRSSAQQSAKHTSSGTASSTQRRSTHTPVFMEHFAAEKEPVPSTQASGGIGAENRENKDFLARFSQQSSNSTFSQESAILPPFARRSQNMDATQASLWRDEEGSWSSGRDSGGNASSTNAPGDRESGLSAFSAISPVTGRSSDSMMPTALFADATNAISTNSQGPLAITSDIKHEERPLSNLESFSRPGNWRQSPTLSSPDQTTTFRKSSPIIQDAPQFHAITTPEREAAPLLPIGTATTSPTQRALSTQTSPTSPRSAQKNERTINGHRKSNASRFSFQLGSDGTEEEKALENKFRESGVLPASDRQVNDEDDEDDYFDEDAMDDMDEMEIQSQMKAAVEPIIEPSRAPEANTLSVKTDAKANGLRKDNLNLSPADKPKEDQAYYEREIPYVPNERELTYAEHPVFRTHSALADSRRNSYQSTLFDSYLASSPHRRSESRDRQASVTSMSAGKIPLHHASHSASRSISGKSPAAMSPLHENGEESSQKPTPVTPTTDITSPSAFSDFRFTESPDRSQSEKRPNRNRADSDGLEKPKWTRTADLWKQYSPIPPVPQIQEPIVPTRSMTTTSTQPSRSYNPQERSFTPQIDTTRSYTPQADSARSYTPQADGAIYKGSYHRGVQVRKPTGVKSPTSPAARISSPSKHDDMYYDDGRFDQDKTVEIQSKTDEAVVDRMSKTGADDLSTLPNRLTMASLSSDGPYPAMISPTLQSHRRGSSILLEDLPLMAPVDPALIPQRNPSEDAKRLGRSSRVPPLPGAESESGTRQNLQAYHQALADAANRAAVEGRFYRKLSIAESTQSSTATEHEVHEASEQNYTREENVANGPAKEPSTQAGSLAFDFGFDQSSVNDSDWADNHDEDEDDIVAAANAEALANDADGFYGSEFGFYAKARPGIDDDATNGGFFGEDGDDGLTRKRSTKEPNLTPITERSEFSTRNSFIGLHNMNSSAISTPALARMPTSALTDNEISFEQLRKLRQNAFGGSNGSLSSQQRSSPTGQHHGGIAMTNAHSNESSNSGNVEQSDVLAQTHSRTGSGSGSISFAR